MKKIKTLLLVSTVMISFASCSDKKSESSQANENSGITTEIITEQITEEQTGKETENEIETEPTTEAETKAGDERSGNGEMEVTYTETTKEIGDEKFGFMQVPEEWIRFKEFGADDSVPLYQYSSPDQISVVTMAYLENTDAKTIADIYYVKLSGDTVDGLTAATVTLDGKTAYQVYGYYADANKVLVAWTFDGEDGLTHSLTIESQDYNIISLSGTYTLRAPLKP